MRSLAIVLACAFFFFAGPASAQYNQAPREPRECTRLTKQIARYKGDQQRAEKAGRELWEQSLEIQVLKLEQRRVARCPQYAMNPGDLIFWNNMLTIAAQAAWKYFTWQY
jgi:hypothetical protein